MQIYAKHLVMIMLPIACIMKHTDRQKTEKHLLPEFSFDCHRHNTDGKT